MGAPWYSSSLWIYLACWTVYTACVWADGMLSASNTNATWDILMKGAKPLSPDAYLCAEYPVEEDEIYIYKFAAMANSSTAHHMLLYGCDGPTYKGVYSSVSKENFWQCPPICQGTQTILFAWAKNAPPTVLPKDVGLRIGKRTTIKTVVIQVHYAKAFKASERPDHSGLKLYLTHKKPKYVAGVFLMLASNFRIPPYRSSFPVDMSCMFSEKKSMFPFAYRTHSHQLGAVITGYKYNGSYYEIGKGNPQWPQAFYPVKESFEVKPGDFLAARCTYDSSNMSRTVHVGATGSDEMCNFYIMFYTDSSITELSYQCFDNHYPQLTGSHFPSDVSVRLPHNATLEDEAKGHHHHHHGGGMPISHLSTKTTQPTTTVAVESGNLQKVLSQNYHLNTVHIHPTDMEPRVKTLNKAAGLKTLVSKSHFQDNRIGTEGNLNDGAQQEKYRYGNFGDVNQRDLSFEKRLNRDYYDDYTANGLRGQGRYDPSEIELSRNRNKDFEAMNQQLGHYPWRNGSSRQHNAQQQQQPQQHQQPLNPPRRRPGVSHPNAQPDRGHSGVQPQTLGFQSQSGGVAKGHQSQIHIEEKLVFNSSWPEQSLNVGQIGGMSTDKNGNLYIFHRASRAWGPRSFDLNDNFQNQNAPIMEDVVVILDANGKLIRKFGSGMFFMPHGIHVDHSNNIWLTDVALHQVFKIPANESKPTLTLGKRFLHSTDLSYFCKPTDVAVLSTGEFYVTDGYCNSRIMKFSPEGKLVKSWGDKSSYLGRHSNQNGFNVPHSITVSESDKQLCVADRENGRIQCFDLDGNFKGIIKHKEFGKRVYAISYCPKHGGLLYAVNGPSFDGHQVIPVQGFTMSMKSGQLIDTWNIPQRFKNPHDVTVDPRTHSVYVGELDPRTVWKLTRMNDKDAEKTQSQFQHDHEDHHDHQDHKDEHEHINNVKKGGTSLPHPSSPSTTESSTHKTYSNDTDENSSSFVQKKKVVDTDPQKVTISMVVGCLLVVPVVLVLVVALLLRGHRSGKLNCFGQGSDKGRHKRVFNFQHLLGNSHKGFDPLSTEESDHDLDPEDSDHDEYTAPRKNKA